MTYIIIKREKCDHDPATFVDLEYEVGNFYPAVHRTKAGCPICGLKGYNDTEVDLIDVLTKISVPHQVGVPNIRHYLFTGVKIAE